MSMKQKAVAFCLGAGCMVALMSRTQPPSAIAVEPIEIVRPIKAERCTNKDCVCLDCKCDPCKCKVEVKPVTYTVDEWVTVTTDELSLYYGGTVNAKRRIYSGKEWLYYNKQMYVRDSRGKFVNYQSLLAPKQTAASCSGGSCSVSGGCSSGSCGVGRGRFFGRWR